MRAATPASSARTLLCTTVHSMNDPHAGPDPRSGPASLRSPRPLPRAGHAPPAEPPVDIVPMRPFRTAKSGHAPRLTKPRSGHAPPSRALRTRMLPCLAHPQIGHAQPVEPRADIVPICPLLTARSGHAPRRALSERGCSPASPTPRLGMPSPRSHGRTSSQCAHAPAQRLDMSPGSPARTLRMPSLRSQGRTECHHAHSAAPRLGMSPGRRGESSAFMLFFIDKATDSKIKSINPTTCDGYH